MALKRKAPKATLSKEDSDFLSQYTKIDNGGNILIDQESFFDYMLTKGARVLVSDNISNPIEAYRAYQDRNEAELIFSQYQEVVGAKKLILYSDKTLY